MLMEPVKSESSLPVSPILFIHPSNRFTSNHQCVLLGLKKPHHLPKKASSTTFFQRRLAPSEKLPTFSNIAQATRQTV